MHTELRDALRALRRSPAYAITAVTTLALGIAALTLSLAFANAFFFRPLPFRADHELVGISMTHAQATGESIDYAVSINDYLALRERNHAFSDIGLINQQTVAAIIGGTPESLQGGRVSASMWNVLGTAPIAGRLYDSTDDRSGAAIAVISYGLQQRAFPGAPASAIGQSLIVDGIARQIIAVMPPGFRVRMNPCDVWLPLGSGPVPQPDARQFQTVARMRPGIARAQATEDVNRIAKMLEDERPATNRGWGASTKDLRAKIGDSARGITIALVGAVLFMLVLTCASAANLAIARVMQRRSDIATRLALGASSLSIARQYVFESILIATLSAAAGVAVAMVALPAALSVLTSDNPLLPLVALDWRVLSLTGAIAAAAGILALGIPSITALRVVTAGALRTSARRSYAGAKEARVRRVLMSVQVASAAILLSATFSAIQALTELSRSDVGFDATSVVMATLAMPAAQYPGLAERSVFVSQVEQRLRDATGISSAGLTTAQFIRDARSQGIFRIMGDETVTEPTLPAELRRVTPGYFTTIGTHLVSGRLFTPADHDSTPAVAVVNTSFVRRYLKGRDPLTTRIQRGTQTPVDIVGVIPDTRDGGASEDLGPAVYLPFFQNSAARVTLIVSTPLASREAEQVIRSAIHSVDPGRPIERVAPLTQMFHESLGEEQFRSIVLGVMTLLAVIIAFVGVYGVTTYVAQQGMREVAIRFALGATQPGIFVHFLYGSLVWIGIGALGGIATAWILGTRFAAQLSMTTPPGLSTYVSVTAVLLASGGIASAVPSIRACLVSPSRVLRGD